MTQQINTNLTNLNTKVDTITTRLNIQDAKINNLNQRVENLEKQTYAEAAKSPPKPQTPKNNTNINANNSTNTNTGTGTQNTPIPGNKGTKKVNEIKNTNLTPAEIMDRARNIVGIYPTNTEDKERNTDMDITRVRKT